MSGEYRRATSRLLRFCEKHEVFVFQIVTLAGESSERDLEKMINVQCSIPAHQSLRSHMRLVPSDKIVLARIRLRDDYPLLVVHCPCVV